MKGRLIYASENSVLDLLMSSCLVRAAVDSDGVIGKFLEQQVIRIGTARYDGPAHDAMSPEHYCPDLLLKIRDEVKKAPAIFSITDQFEVSIAVGDFILQGDKTYSGYLLVTGEMAQELVRLLRPAILVALLLLDKEVLGLSEQAKDLDRKRALLTERIAE
ncbi:hypothetical protein HQ571_06620 [Candidatus Kuenenbacteria bacterium]|nr:hypothetical protein [Candidatus Kuenenbacteria bacterium]